MTTSTWMAIASICDCNGVAITLMDRYGPDTEPDGPHEVIALGEDWRQLATETALALHRRTELPIFARCTTVVAYGPDADTVRASAADHMYALADETSRELGLF